MVKATLLSVSASFDAFVFNVQRKKDLFSLGDFVHSVKHPSACGNTPSLTSDAFLLLLLFRTSSPCRCFVFPPIILSMWLKVHDDVLNIDHPDNAENKACIDL